MALFGKKKKGAEDATPDMPSAASESAAPSEIKEPKIAVRPDVYTLLLGLSVTALIIGTVLLYLNFNAYGPDPFAGLPRG